MTKANPILHVDIPTGSIESEDIDRFLSDAPENPLYSHAWYSGSQDKPNSLTLHNWNQTSVGERNIRRFVGNSTDRKLIVVLMPSSPRKRESTSIRKASEFSIFTEIARLPGARPWLDRENERSLVSTVWNTDDPPGMDRESLKQEVYGLIEEAGTENWDGEGALALAPETVTIARKLIDHFPSYVIRPDVAATPHGEVDFDWIISQDVMLTVSVCPSGEIAFAGLFHDTRLNGREPWTDALPQFVDCCFERLRETQSQ